MKRQITLCVCDGCGCFYTANTLSNVFLAKFLFSKFHKLWKIKHQKSNQILRMWVNKMSLFLRQIQTANKYLKKYSTSIALRKIKIKTVGLQYQAWIPSYWASLSSNSTAIGYDHDICATTEPSQSSYCAGQCCGLQSELSTAYPPEQKGLNINFWHHKSQHRRSKLSGQIQLNSVSCIQTVCSFLK